MLLGTSCPRGIQTHPPRRPIAVARANLELHRFGHVRHCPDIQEILYIHLVRCFQVKIFETNSGIEYTCMYIKICTYNYGIRKVHLPQDVKSGIPPVICKDSIAAKTLRFGEVFAKGLQCILWSHPDPSQDFSLFCWFIAASFPNPRDPRDYYRNLEGTVKPLTTLVQVETPKEKKESLT